LTQHETHLPPLDLPYGNGTKARWAINPEGNLLVFVHGFKGSAVDTWKGFPSQLAPHAKIHGYDLVYFGYESVVQTAGESANQLHRFLDDVLTKTDRTVNKSLGGYDISFRREKEWAYKEVVLVGHSLGACVIRRAMLNQLQGGRNSWSIDGIKMLWFAPAHSGARIFRLLTAASLGFSVGGLDSLATFFAPSLQDLSPGSDFLRKLRDETDELREKFPFLNANLTFWAWKDKVVLNDPFKGDVAPFEEVRGVNHISICKPNAYGRTVELLLDELP
jgi:pimeloyl-ACP methyl ester carboxylesterase